MWATWLLCGVVAQNMSAQQNPYSIKGKVLFEDGTTAPSAFVELMKKDSSGSLAFTTSDENGIWQHSMSGDSALVRVRMMAHITVWRWYFLSSKDTVPLVLLDANSLLPDVVIKAQTYGVLQNGDTLKFQLQSFSNGREQTLGDILKKLPGVTLEGGIIKYQGKKIDKLLLHGKDILNNQHKASSESIEFSKLESVQLINHYKDALEAFDGSKSDKVALDVRLKQTALHRLSGLLGAFGGIKNRYRSENNLFNIHETKAFNFFLNANNTNKNTLSVFDALDMAGGLEVLVHLPEVMDKLLEQYTAQGAKSNNIASDEGVLNFGYEDKETDFFTWKAAAYTTFSKRRNEASFQRNYFSDTRIFDGKNVNVRQKSVFGGSLAAVYQPDEKNIVKIFGSYHQDIYATNEQSDGIFVGKNADFGQESCLKTHSLLFNTVWAAKMPNAWKNTLKITAFVDNSVGFHALNDLNPIFGLPIAINTNTKTYYLRQSIVDVSQSVALQNDYKKTWKNWSCKFSARYNATSANSDLGANRLLQTPFTNGNNYFSQILGSDAQLSYEQNKWNFSCTLGFRHRKSALNGQFFSQNFPAAELLVDYNFSKTDQIRIKYSHQQNAMSLEEVRNGYQILDARTAVAGGIGADNLTAAHNVGLFYKLVNYQGFFIFCSVNQSFRSKIPTDYSQFATDYFVQKRILTPSNSTTTAAATISAPLQKLRAKATITCHFLDNGGFAFIENQLQNTRQTNHIATLQMDSKWNAPVELSFKTNFQHNVQKIANQTNQYQSYEVGGSIDIAPVKSLKLANLLAFTNAKSKVFGQKQQNNFWNIGFNYTYQAPASSWRWSLIGDNLLHLKPTQLLKTNFTDAYADYYLQRIMAGYLLLGMQFVF